MKAITGAACVLVVLLAAGLVLWLALRSRKRRSPTVTPARVTPASAPDPTAGLSDEELSRRANALLVDADDAIKTSEEELGFAVAQYGTEATESFTSTVATAKQEVARAFQLRQELDDSTPEDPQTRRAMLAEIIRRCEVADQRLDAEADAFDALRDLEGRLDIAIADVKAGRDASVSRLPEVRHTMQTLRSTYADSALRSVSDNIEQAQDRIQFASDALTQAEVDAQRGDRSAAAVAVRAAQEAISQASTLLGALKTVADDLATANGAVRPRSLTSTPTSPRAGPSCRRAAHRPGRA